MNDQPPQPIVGFRTNEEWQTLIAQASTMIEDLERVNDETLRRKLFATMETIDAIHREALHRLVRLFKKGVLEQVVTDPAIRTLMGMYDLLPPEPPDCAKVWDFMPAASQNENRMSPVTVQAPKQPPHWTPAPLHRLPCTGETFVCEFDEGPVLVANVLGQYFATRAWCSCHDAPMRNGELSHYSLVCEHGDGCVFDIRSGARLGGGGPLSCLPIREDVGGRLLIGFGIPFSPRLPPI
jgi:nitrite reductase/ring-hydroxylating ferredoxin subunit